MERHHGLFVFAVVLYAVSLLEVSPAFLALPTGDAKLASNARLRGRATGSGAAPGASLPPLRAILQAASTMLALSACALCSRRRSSNHQAPRTQRLATVSPTIVYTYALTDAAVKMKEEVRVTKDVIKVKTLFKQDDFRDELFFFINEPGQSEIQKAQGLVKLFGGMESTVFPKFLVYLAKKRRLQQIWSICDEYVTTVYETQQILPVVIRSAQRLTDDQKDRIKEKMKVKTGASEIKLICEVNTDLRAGFEMEWGFTDPETLATPTEGLDLSLKAIVIKKAVSKGVLVQV